MQWPQLTTEIVQAGAYSSVEKGGEVQSEMTSAGHPTSLIPSNDKFFLFIGLGQVILKMGLFVKKRSLLNLLHHI